MPILLCTIEDKLNIDGTSKHVFGGKHLGEYHPPLPTASVDNTLFDLHNYSDDTQRNSIFDLLFMQLTPSPVYPVRQVHLNEPGTSTHEANLEQLWLPSMHSLISVQVNHIIVVY